MEQEEDNMETIIHVYVPVMIVLWVIYRMMTLKPQKFTWKSIRPFELSLFQDTLNLFGLHQSALKLANLSSQTGDVIQHKIGSRQIVFISNPKDVELILSSYDHIEKSPEYDCLEPWFETGLLISTSLQWSNFRRIIAPIFSQQILKTFFPTFNNTSKEVVEKLRNHVGNEVECHDHMTEAVMNILLENIVGISTKERDGDEYSTAFKKLCDILIDRQNHLFFKSNIIFNYSSMGKTQNTLIQTTNNLIRKILKAHKEVYVKNDKILPGSTQYVDDDKGNMLIKSTAAGVLPNGPKGDGNKENDDKNKMVILDYLLDNSQNGVMIMDVEIVDQVNMMIFKGHNTTALSSSYFLCMMAARPDIQDKVYAEVNKVLGSKTSVSYEDTGELKYLERCLLETLRLFPPIPVVGRILNNNVKLASCDQTIPAGASVYINTALVHRRPDQYHNPNTFNPDNFLPENCARRHYYSYIPFSAGPRSCLGRKYAMLKLKVLLATIIKNYRIMPGQKEDTWQLRADMFLRRADGFKVKFEPRQST